MPTTSTTSGRRPETPIPDRGCAFSARCADCWLAECWYVMPVAERQELRATLKALQKFTRRPDTALVD